MMNRRALLAAAGAAATAFPMGWTADAQGRKKKILFFSKSSGFEHSAIKRKDGALSFAEQTLTDWGQQHGFDVDCTKDGSVFTRENLGRYDALFFYTTGTLTDSGTDKNPPMTPEGKAAFLDLIRNGKGFLGVHSATDTFHTLPDPPDRSQRFVNHGEGVDPYVAMIGGEFIKHGPQQKARMTAVDNRFPGCSELGEGFELMEEWYSIKDFRKDLHVLLVQETRGMNGSDYQRPPYPATWARRHGRGRVFYTSMGHREDVWTNPIFQNVVLGGISWALRNVDADVSPNLDRVAPGHAVLPPMPPPAR